MLHAPPHDGQNIVSNLVNDQQLGVAASMLDLSGGGVRAELYAVAVPGVAVEGSDGVWGY